MFHFSFISNKKLKKKKDKEVKGSGDESEKSGVGSVDEEEEKPKKKVPASVELLWCADTPVLVLRWFHSIAALAS